MGKQLIIRSDRVHACVVPACLQWVTYNLSRRECCGITGSGLREACDAVLTECEGAALAVLLAARGGSHAACGRWAGDMIALISAPLTLMDCWLKLMDGLGCMVLFVE